MSDREDQSYYRPTFPAPAPEYSLSDQQNVRHFTQRALDYKLDKNAFDEWLAGGGGGGGSGMPTGGGTDQIFYENGLVVTTDYTIPADKNAGTFGPVTINPGVVVTVPPTSTWVIV